MKKTVLVLLIFILLIAITWGGLLDPTRHKLQLQNTGYNSHFDSSHFNSFESYIVYSSQQIKLARMAAKVDFSDATIRNNSPGEWLPNSAQCKKNLNGKYDNGILLIHGFTDSPYTFHAVADYLSKKCFLVRVILLPGHGSVPGDLLNVTYQDWTNAVDYGINSFSGMVNNLYIGGLSLGGLLAINAIQEHPQLFKGAVLFAPLLKFKSKIAWLIPWQNALSKIIPRLKWIDHNADLAPTFYESTPIKQVYQMHLLLNKVNKKLISQKLTLPIFIEQSAQDKSVTASATLNLFRNNSNPKSRLMWFTNKNPKPNFNDSRIQVLDSRLPEQRIISFSHISLLLGAEDPLYGANGSYRYCLQYKENSADWITCKTSNSIVLGEITDENLQRYEMRRLLYNAYFPYFLEQLTLFFNIDRKT